MSLATMESCINLRRESTIEVVDTTEYRSIIGTLQYFLHTWPKLAFSIRYLSRFREEMHEDQLAVVRRVGTWLVCYRLWATLHQA